LGSGRSDRDDEAWRRRTGGALGSALARLARLARRHWRLLAGVAALAGLVVAVNPGQLDAVVRNLQIRPLLLMPPTAIAIHAIRALGWRSALHRVGVTIGVGRAILVVLAARPFAFLPAGDLARVPLLQAGGAAVGRGGEVVATIAFQEVAFLTLMGLSVIPALGRLPWLGALVVVLLAADLAVWLVLLWGPAYRWARSWAERWKWLSRFHDDLDHLRPAFLRLFSAPTAARVLLSNAGAVALSFLLFKLALASAGQGQVGYPSAAFTYALAHILSGLSMLPGGLGAYEGILTGFLALQGIPPASGATAAILQRLFYDGFVALVGLAAAIGVGAQVARGGAQPPPEASRSGERPRASCS
jgi:uncharacterized membrane protein YbhN (UPF0104 family)